MADGPAYPPPQPVQRPGPGEAPPPSNVYGPAGTPSSGTAPGITVGKPATGGRRWWMFVVGLLLLLLSLVPVVVGGIVLAADSISSSVDPEVQDRLPDADLSFRADDATYEVFVSGSGSTDSDAADVSCQVTLADGEQVEVDGTVQVVGTSFAGSHSVGSFDAVEGDTEVRCTGGGAGNERIYIAEDSGTVELVGWIAIGVGVLGILLGLALLFAGLFWRKPLPQQITPIP